LSNEEIDIFPNTFTEKTTIVISLKQQSHVKIELFDNMGQHIKNIANFISISSGYQQDINFKEMGLRPGMYFISIAVDGKVRNSKVEFSK
jgi:hypothetical protein